MKNSIYDSKVTTVSALKSIPANTNIIAKKPLIVGAPTVFTLGKGSFLLSVISEAIHGQTMVGDREVVIAKDLHSSCRSWLFPPTVTMY